DALSRGALIEHGNRAAAGRAVKSGREVLPELALTGAAKLLNKARGARWLFWEPFRFFSVRPGEYDLVHVHVFSAKFLSLPCPLVVSNAAPLRYLYSEARCYGPARVRLLEGIEQGLGRLLGVNVTSYRLPQASRMIAFTQYLRDWYVRRRIMP